jgi:hypothetical protein
LARLRDRRPSRLIDVALFASDLPIRDHLLACVASKHRMYMLLSAIACDPDSFGARQCKLNCSMMTAEINCTAQ